MLAAEPWAYRNRIRLAFDAAGNFGYRGRRSHAIVPIRECPIAAPLLIDAARARCEIARSLQPSMRPTEISLFCDAEEAALLASVYTPASTTEDRFDDFAQALAEQVPALKARSWWPRARPGKPRIHRAVGRGCHSMYRAAGFDYRVDHGAFFQVNRWLVDALVERVTAGHNGELAWDLFAGVGLFARKLDCQL